MKQIKWSCDGVKFTRGNHESLIARFDNSRVWLVLRACCTTSTFRAEIRNLALTFGAKEVKIKPAYFRDDAGNVHRTEKDVVGFICLSHNSFL